MRQAIETVLPTPPNQAPSAAFLVALNGLLFLLTLLPGLNPIGLIIAIPATAVFLAVSGLWQAFWIYANRRIHLHNALRCIGFILPFLLIFLPPLLGFGPKRKANQQRPSVSLAGNYLAYVTAKPAGWFVEFKDKNGVTVHEEQTECMPQFNVYWTWGPKDIFWLYNSDDGGVHCWKLNKQKQWTHINWGHGRTPAAGISLGPPPPSLHPHYAVLPAGATEQMDEREPNTP